MQIVVINISLLIKGWARHSVCGIHQKKIIIEKEGILVFNKFEDWNLPSKKKQDFSLDFIDWIIILN